jgi:hypothetical protein
LLRTEYSREYVEKLEAVTILKLLKGIVLRHLDGGKRSIFDVLRKGFLTFFRMLFKALMLNICGCVLVRSGVWLLTGIFLPDALLLPGAGCVASLNAPYVGSCDVGSCDIGLCGMLLEKWIILLYCI